MNNTGTNTQFGGYREILEKQAALEAGFAEMERGLQALGARIEDCREQIRGPSEIADLAVNASRLERKFLSLRKKMTARDQGDIDAQTRAAIRDLAEKNRERRFNTRALERETRRNSRILNKLAEKLKAELNKKRADELKAAREKAARIKLQQNPPKKAARPHLRAVPKKSADIVPFPARAKR